MVAATLRVWVAASPRVWVAAAPRVWVAAAPRVWVAAYERPISMIKWLSALMPVVVESLSAA